MFSNFTDRIRLFFRKDKEPYLCFYRILGFYPHNISLYEQALLHKSSSVKSEKGRLVNNERLEFLGDAILDAVVADIVYKKFEGKREGFLTNTRSKIVQRETLNRLAEHHKKNGNTVTVLSAMIDNPTGYGRIIRDAEGRFVKSVEHKDASPEELESHEINSGMYIFDTKELKEALDKLTPNNAQGEYYLPDTLTIIKNKGLKVDAFALDDPEDITGVNDQEQLAAAAEIIRARTAK